VCRKLLEILSLYFDISITTGHIFGTGQIAEGELSWGSEVHTARNPTIRLDGPFYLNSESVWCYYKTIMVGRFVFKYNLYCSSYWQVFVCRMLDCVWCETERRLVVLCFQLFFIVRH